MSKRGTERARESQREKRREGERKGRGGVKAGGGLGSGATIALLPRRSLPPPACRHFKGRRQPPSSAFFPYRQRFCTTRAKQRGEGLALTLRKKGSERKTFNQDIPVSTDIQTCGHFTFPHTHIYTHRKIGDSPSYTYTHKQRKEGSPFNTPMQSRAIPQTHTLKDKCK